MRRQYVFICLLILIIFPVRAIGIAPPSLEEFGPKVSELLVQKLAHANAETKQLCLVHLTSSAWTGGVVQLSDRALSRRAKVDPENRLVDSLDFILTPTALERISSTGCRVRHELRWIRSLSVEATLSQIRAIAAVEDVTSIRPIRTLTYVRSDSPDSRSPKIVPESLTETDYGLSWEQNEFAKATKLHRAGLSGLGVRIAILDSGFDLTHPAFDSINLVSSWDFINSVASVDQFDCPTQSDSRRQSYHGTLVAGVVAGFAPGELIGPAYNCELMLAKTEITCDDVEVRVEEDNWIAAAQWADAGGADIISSSLGYFSFQDGVDYTFGDLDGETALITIAADIAASKNILVVTSAGNERGTAWNHITAPADGDFVIAVGAAKADSSLAAFSSPGPTADGRIKPDVTSLGVSVIAAYDRGGYRTVSGTSFSAPLVAATAALALEHDNMLTAIELRKQLLETASQSDTPDNDFGFGLFDGARAAGIVSINSIEPQKLFSGESRTLPVTTSGRSDSIPSLSAFNLPSGSILVDSGNGRGSLTIIGPSAANTFTQVGLVADVGYFADTTMLILETYSPGTGPILFGPNPFTESVNIIVKSSSAEPVSVTVFNSSGEKIRELVDQSTTYADDSIRVIEWDGRNSAGREVASGVYLAHVKSARHEAILKFLKTD
ncbi:MAG: S8 family serine peptidase [bacterium]|nr:S8 family serine peptidase [bacterium]